MVECTGLENRSPVTLDRGFESRPLRSPAILRYVHRSWNDRVVIKEFRDFLLRGNVVDLAVAVVIGAAFAALVNSLVADVLTPIIGAIVGKPDFSNLNFTINGSEFNYGNFLNALIAFLSVAAAVFFFVIKPMNTLNRLRGASSQEEATELELLTEIRDELRSQRGAS